MARTAEPVAARNEIIFELERFERTNGQLTLSGRWFGVRGRRFVRPTLTLAREGERVRALADLDDKPWAAEDGEPWRASFPWGEDGRVEEPELSVAPDITVQLPIPGTKRSRPERLAAQPRRETMDASWRPGPSAVETVVHEAEPGESTAAPGEAGPRQPRSQPESEPELKSQPQRERQPASDPAAVRAELEGLRGQLAEAGNAAAAAGLELGSAREQLAALRTELEEAQRALESRAGELESVRAELASARAGREAALRSAAQAEAEREDTLQRAGEAEAERDALAVEKAELAGALEQSRSLLDQLSRQREEVVAARGAALVMRGATQALPAYEHHVGWGRRALAVVLLLGIVFAVLIVLGAI